MTQSCEFSDLNSYLCWGRVERAQTGSMSDTRQGDRELGCFQPLTRSLFPLWLVLSSHRVITQLSPALHWSTHFFESYSETKKGDYVKVWVLSLLCTTLLQVTWGHRLFRVSCSIKWQITRSHRKFCKNMGMHMNSLFSYSCRETRAGHFLACREKKKGSQNWLTHCFLGYQCLHNQCTYAFMYAQSHEPQTSPSGFICRGNKSTMCEFAFMSV